MVVLGAALGIYNVAKGENNKTRRRDNKKNLCETDRQRYLRCLAVPHRTFLRF